jgi:hypothetical protein
MNMTVGIPRVWERWKGAGHIALTAVFEDSNTCTRVKDFCQAMARELGAHCKITQHVWMFSTFRMEELREIAAREAAVADLVILAARPAESLPEEVQNWIEKWLEQKGARRSVLLALLDRPFDGSVNPVGTYLEKVADRGGLDLLVDLGEGP